MAVHHGVATDNECCAHPRRMGSFWKNVSFAFCVTAYHSTTSCSLFRSGYYAQASVAFRQATRKIEAALCNAYHLRENAFLVVDGTARIEAFGTVADAFFACAQCFTPKQAKAQLTCYETAGDYYSKAQSMKKAGDSYKMAEKYSKAASAYREGGFVDEIIEVIIQRLRLSAVTPLNIPNSYSNAFAILR